MGEPQRYLRQPWPDGPNIYMDKIEANMKRLREVLSTDDNTAILLKNIRAGSEKFPFHFLPSLLARL